MVERREVNGVRQGFAHVSRWLASRRRLVVFGGLATPRGMRAFIVDAIAGLLGVGNPSGRESPAAFRCGPAATEPGLWTPAVALISSLALFCGALAANASRAGSEQALPAFYLCLAAMIVPAATRLAMPDVARRERIELLALTALALFVARTIREPLLFIDHDEYLHWVTAQNILAEHRLFSPNTLFPVGPFYPGLEIATTALVSLSEASVFVAGCILLGVARLFFVVALFLFMEQATRSPRIAGLAALCYMGCSTFVFFDAHFSYESLSLPIMALALLIEPSSGIVRNASPRLRIALFVAVVLAVAVTHHMTSYGLAGLIILRTALEAIRVGPARVSKSEWAAAVAALAVPMLWSRAMGNPGSGYLGPVLLDGIAEVINLVNAPGNRKLFTSDDGILAPAWQRYTAIGSVLLICTGLSLGFFRSLAWGGMTFARKGPGESLVRRALRWDNSWLVLLTLITFGFPASIIFRLTRSGWEIGNRIPPFAFLGVGLLLAIVSAGLIQRRSQSLGLGLVSGACAAIIICGGIISAEGPRVLVPRDYQVSADAASIEPMGVAAAVWARNWLGPGHTFIADRVNRLLLSGFGRQQVSTTLDTGIDASVALIAAGFGEAEKAMLTDAGIDFVMSDLRITTGRPVVGSYFDGGLADQLSLDPPEPAALLKFDAVPGVLRVFDNGNQVIYDVRSLSAPH